MSAWQDAAAYLRAIGTGVQLTTATDHHKAMRATADELVRRSLLQREAIRAARAYRDVVDNELPEALDERARLDDALAALGAE